MSLSGSETRKCVNVTIINDQIVEKKEPFEVTITFPSGQEAIDSGEIVPPSMQISGTINIIDDDGELIWNGSIYRKLFVPLHMCAIHFIVQLDNSTVIYKHACKLFKDGTRGCVGWCVQV